jgi:hypothetical protein
LYFIGHFAQGNGLRIGIADDEVHTFYILAIHVVNGIAAAATYTYHFDDRGFFFGQIKLNHG